MAKDHVMEVVQLLGNQQQKQVRTKKVWPTDHDPKAAVLLGERTIRGIHFSYSHKQDWEDEDRVLHQMFIQARTFEGIQKLHSLIPVSSPASMVKVYLKCDGSKDAKVTIEEGEVPFDDIRGFVTEMYDQKWWLAYVLQTFSHKSEEKVSFLTPAGPNPSLMYWSHPGTFMVPSSDTLLTLVDPVITRTGRTYHLRDKEHNKATKY